jgi:hypothetical protein
MATKNFYTDDDLFTNGEEPTDEQWNARVLTLHQTEFEKRWSTGRGWFATPTVTPSSTNLVLSDVDCLVYGKRVTNGGTVAFAGAAAGTYYIQVTILGTFTKVKDTPDAGKLTVGTQAWTGSAFSGSFSMDALATAHGIATVEVNGVTSTILAVQGAWTSGVHYIGTSAQIDIVNHNGASYYALASHTAAAATEPGVGADWETAWSLASDRGLQGLPGQPSPAIVGKGNWAAGQGYVISNAVVGSDGAMYLCIANHTSTTDDKPTTGVNWQTYWRLGVQAITGGIGVTGTSIRYRLSWATATAYVNNATYIDAVSHEGNVYFCILSHTSGAASEPGVGASWSTYWHLSVPQAEYETAGEYHNTWELGHAYIHTPSADRVRHTGGTYRCILGHTADADSEPGIGADWQTYWVYLAKDGEDGSDAAYVMHGDWTEGHAYSATAIDAVVGSDNAGYACIVDHTSTTDDKPTTGANWETYWMKYVGPGGTGQNGTPGASPSYQGDWSALTSYGALAMVRHVGCLFVSKQASNLNHEPVAETTDDWWGFAAKDGLDGSGALTPSATVADLDGSGGAGTSDDYSRGDHKHADAQRHQQNTDAGSDLPTFSVRHGETDVTPLTPQAYMVDRAQTTGLNLYMEPYIIFAVRDTSNHAELVLGGPYACTDNANNWLVVDYADLTVKVITGSTPSASDYHVICNVTCAGGAMTIIDPWPHPSATITKPGGAGGAYEPALGNPDVDGKVLSSLADGTRSWITPGGGATDFVDLGDVPAAYTDEGGKFVAVKEDETGLEFVAAPSSPLPAAIYDFPAGSFYYPASNPAPLDRDTGTNGIIFRHLFDDTTQEYVEGVIQLPSDLDTAGTITLEAYGYATTAPGGAVYVQLSFEHSARADSESWDAAYTAEDSGDKEVDTTQDDLDYWTWTETVANAGWAASDHVRFKLSRKAPSGTDLTGDWGLTHFRIVVPRA